MSKELGVGMCFYNPYNFEKMNANIIQTASHLLKSWKEVWVIELIYNSPGLNPVPIKPKLPKGVNYIQVKAKSLMWHKEQLLNILAKRAIEEKGYEAFAIFDADIIFTNPDWPQRIIAKLEDYKMVQCYSKGQSGWAPDKEPQSKKPSYLFRWLKEQKLTGSYPGGAWAMHKDFWIGPGLWEYNIIGGGDSAFASCVTYDAAGFDDWEKRHPELFSFSYSSAYLKYRKELGEFLNSKYFYVKQEALYQEHGIRKNRLYANRQKAIESIDLELELIKNKDGLFEWAKPTGLRAKFIQNYFQVRNAPTETTDANVMVPCVCKRKCFVNNKLHQAGTRYEVPLKVLNDNFKVTWT